VKLFTTLPGTNPDILYDVLHDPDYRKEWDENMIEGYNIEQIDTTNDVGYYSAKVSYNIYRFHSTCVMFPKFENIS
jgi:hypothetical protein